MQDGTNSAEENKLPLGKRQVQDCKQWRSCLLGVGQSKGELRDHVIGILPDFL
jgi:hypothetical protein